MNQEKLKSYLEITTNVAVLLVALVILGTLAWRYFTPKPEIRLQSGLQKGAVFPELPSINYNISSKTLLIALSSKCDYCSEGLPFYKELARVQQENSNSSRVIAIFSDTKDEVKQYVQGNGLDLETVSGIDFKAVNLIATPSIILVDNAGRIIDFWIGKPSKDVEQQIIKVLGPPGDMTRF
jgi:thioredoxin-related protein